MARSVLERVRAENPDAAPQEFRRIASKACPFGERRYWPYKVWLSEVRRFTKIVEWKRRKDSGQLEFPT